jgi:CubicO group peptidase (beta-lactamase class C family)
MTIPAIATLVWASSALAQTPTLSPVARVDSFMSRAAQQGLSGTLLVARHDSIVLLRGYGFADRESRTPPTASSPYFLGSIGKQFTAAAILRLEADGRLSVHDSLSRFFPQARGAIANVTLDQMMSHTSGLPYLPTHGLFGEGTRDSVMREMLNEPLGFQPGSRYDYSSVGFILLAGVIERASGMPYEQFIQSRIFAPAELRSAGFIGDSARWATTPMRSYSDGTAEPPLAGFPAAPRMVGAGSIVMSVPDLYQWYRSLLDGRVLPKASVEKLFEPRTQIRAGSSGGYAWTIATVPAGQLRLIAGDIGGYNAELRHYVDEQTVVVFGSNRRIGGAGDREVVMNSVARLMRGEALPPTPRPEI